MHSNSMEGSSSNHAAVVFDDSIFNKPAEKIYSVKALITVDVDIRSSEENVASVVREALSKMKVEEDAHIVGSRVSIHPFKLGENVH